VDHRLQSGRPWRVRPTQRDGPAAAITTDPLTRTSHRRKEEVNVVNEHSGRPTKRGESHALRTDQTVRLSVNLTPEEADKLKGYADRKQISITEAVRRAISVLLYVAAAQDRGASINVEEGDSHSLKEVVFVV
jgi:hypothetical protein